MPRGLAIWRRDRRRARARNALWGIGNWRYFHDADDRGVAEFKDALAIFRRIGDRTMEAWSLHMIGTALVRLLDAHEARRDIAAGACGCSTTYGDVAGITLCLDDFAALAVADDDLPRAARLWGAARALSSAGGVGLADFVDQQYEFYSRPNARFVLGPRIWSAMPPKAGDDARRERRVRAGRPSTRSLRTTTRGSR